MWFYNALVVLGDVAFIACVLMFLPLALFRSKRRFAGFGLKYASYIFALNLWMYALLKLWQYWGLVAVIVGVVFTPIAASLMAGIAATLHKDWWTLFVVVSYVVVVILANAGGGRLAESGYPPAA